MTEISSVKALAFDMDGTLLLPDKTIGGRTLAALRACMDRGIQVILSTGRGVEAVEPYRRELGAAGPHVYYNGAEVAAMEPFSLIHASLLESAPVLFCLELARKRGLYFQVYFPSKTLVPEIFDGPAPDLTREILLTEKPGAEAEYYRKNSGLAALKGDIEAALSASGRGVIKCMFITKEEFQDGLRAAIQERFGDGVTIVRSSPIYLEVIAKGVSKGAGLMHALDWLGIAPQRAAAFGDEENDLPMFAAAGFSAAPANAAAPVLEAADFHIPSNADEGVACFLEEHVLKLFGN
jgi:Cof subfamily protein (haloacid dehalogenase superfamily)